MGHMAKGGRPRINPAYDLRIVNLAGEGLTAEKIYEKLRAEVINKRREDFPSLPTVKGRIAKYRARARKDLDAPFRWPYSMYSGPGSSTGATLTWEESQAGLELLRDWDQQGLGRPTNRLVRWYARLVQARPDIQRGL